MANKEFSKHFIKSSTEITSMIKFPLLYIIGKFYKIYLVIKNTVDIAAVDSVPSRGIRRQL